MPLVKLCSVFILLFSTATFAQDMMPTTSGGMDKHMTPKPMPEKVEDSRVIITLTEAEKAIVMEQMRQMLSSVQGITDGLAQGDSQAVLESASKSGPSMMQDLPSQIRMKFPEPFSQMGMATHMAFDKIVQEAKDIKSPVPILKQLSVAIQNCDACHATYRFALPK